MILKIISFFLILYLLWRVFGFVFRALFMVMGKRVFDRAKQQQQQYQQQQYRQTRNSDGSIRIDHVPPKSKKEETDFKGGEYVDYEEIKKK